MIMEVCGARYGLFDVTACKVDSTEESIIKKKKKEEEEEL